MFEMDCAKKVDRDTMRERIAILRAEGILPNA